MEEKRAAQEPAPGLKPLTPGTILTDDQIRMMVQSGKLISTDSFDDDALDVCSYDVHISRAILGGAADELDLAQQSFEIPPGGYAAAISRERLITPKDIVVRINAKRSMAYLGLALLTGAQVDPGYEGHLLFGFYNASSKKAVLGANSSICSLVFESLAGPVAHPKASDPDLAKGRFPQQFIREMANMEVLSLQQLSEQISTISREVFDLRAKYNDVMQPIKLLTINVEALTKDVGELHNGLVELDTFTARNAKAVDKVNSSIEKMLIKTETTIGEVSRLSQVAGEHDKSLTKLSNRYSVFYVLVYIVGAIILLVVGALFSEYVWPKLFGTLPPSPP